MPLLLSLSGCYSLAELREERVVRAGDREATLEVQYRVGRLREPPRPVADVVLSMLSYPLDIFVSLGLAVTAPFDPEFDVSGGVVGGLGAIVLPGLTLFPGYAVLKEDLELEPEAYDELMAGIEAGRGAEAYARAHAGSDSDGSVGTVVSVEHRSRED